MTPGRASYAWGSILKARSVLNLGVKWRVEDETKINIWKDRCQTHAQSHRWSNTPIKLKKIS